MLNSGRTDGPEFRPFEPSRPFTTAMQSRDGGQEQEGHLIPRMCSRNRVKYLSTVRDGSIPALTINRVH